MCVQYKYDNQNKKRITTIEVIADEQDWQSNKTFITKNKIVQLRTNYGEVDLARKVKSMGGKWNKEKKVRELAYDYFQALRLVKRIVDQKMRNYYCRNPAIHVSNIRNFIYF